MGNDDTIVNNGHSSENRSEKHHHKSSHKSKEHSKDKSKHKDKHRDKDKEKSKHKDRHDKEKEKKHSSHSSSTSHAKSAESATHSSSSSKTHKSESDGKKLSSSSLSSSSHHHHHHHKKSSSSSSSSVHKTKSSKDGSSDKHKSSAGKHGDGKAKLKEELDAEVKNEPMSQNNALFDTSNGNANGNSLDSSCDYDFAKFKTLKEEQDEEDERNAKASNNGLGKNEDDDDVISGSRKSKHAKPLLSDDENVFKCESDNNGYVNTVACGVKRENGVCDTKSEPDNSIKNEEENDDVDDNERNMDDGGADEEYGNSNADDDEDVEDSKDFNDNDNDEEDDESEEEEKIVKKKSKKSKLKKRRKSYSDDDNDEDVDSDDNSDDDDDYDDDSKAKSKQKRKHESSKSRKSTSTSTKKPPAEKKPNVKSDSKTSSVKDEGGKKRKSLNSSNEKPSKRVKKEETEEVWKWWEEEKKDDGVKWKFLEHKGPMFAPPYEPLPKSVKFYYDGKHVPLSQDAEEIAGFYAKMLENDYTTKPIFNTNFFTDWRKSMTHTERKLITDLKKCDFKEMHRYFVEKSEQNRNKTKEEKQALKEKNEEIINEYGYCTIDGHKERIANFRIEPPGLFRGRGEHPKMGMLKKRVMPEDVIINCSKDSKKPNAPDGHRWKEIRHDCSVTWLASWTENVQSQVKYVMLNPSSKIKGEKDWQKYEIARKLAKTIDRIRDDYREDWKSKEMRVRQRAVALYFIDRLALRAGNEKDEDQADTVGCCSLRVEHIQLAEHKDGKDYVVIFDFLGKDSIRYYNEVPVEKRVFKNLQLFMENKSPSDDLFDRLNTAILNKHLTELMPGLTAKVFRTYNASSTLQDQLDKLTVEDNKESEKMLSYNRANRAVAILCNHQRSVPKSHQKSMDTLREKIEKKKEAISDAEAKVSDAKKKAKNGSVKEKMEYDRKKKQLERLRDQLIKLNVQETDRDENKTIALGTSKLNYLDPRISVAWCKKYNVNIEKVYNKTQRMKFRWAIDMANADYRF